MFLEKGGSAQMAPSKAQNFVNGGLAQVVERALRMREVAGSMHASSKLFSLLLTKISLNF